MKRLKELRNGKNKTQKDIAQYLNVADITISRYEGGEREPDFDTLKQLADFFDVSVDYLLEKTDDPAPPAKRGQKKEALAGASEGELMFALFGEVSEDITEDDMKDVRRYAEFIAERKRKEREGK